MLCRRCAILMWPSFTTTAKSRSIPLLLSRLPWMTTPNSASANIETDCIRKLSARRRKSGAGCDNGPARLVKSTSSSDNTYTSAAHRLRWRVYFLKWCNELLSGIQKKSGWLEMLCSVHEGQSCPSCDHKFRAIQSVQCRPTPQVL